MSPQRLTLTTSRKAFLGLAACLLTGFFAQCVVADTGDSAPKLISTTGGKGRTWNSMATLKKAADAGDAKACLQYGDALLFGNDVAKDVTQAMEYLRKAAAHGEANASFRLGKVYDDGELATKDYAKAFEHYSDAAKGGVPEAQYNLGVMYASGRGVKRDYVEGLAWLVVATKNGAAGEGEKQTREHLTKINRQAQIAAAEKRADEILNDPVVAAQRVVEDTKPSATTKQKLGAPAKVDLTEAAGPAKVSVTPPTPLPAFSPSFGSGLSVPSSTPPAQK